MNMLRLAFGGRHSVARYEKSQICQIENQTILMIILLVFKKTKGIL